MNFNLIKSSKAFKPAHNSKLYESVDFDEVIDTNRAGMSRYVKKSEEDVWLR